MLIPRNSQSAQHRRYRARATEFLTALPKCPKGRAALRDLGYHGDDNAGQSALDYEVDHLHSLGTALANLLSRYELGMISQRATAAIHMSSNGKNVALLLRRPVEPAG